MALYGLDNQLPVEYPIEINRESHQAFGLCQWYPGVLSHGANAALIQEMVSGFKKAYPQSATISVPNTSHVGSPFGAAFPISSIYLDGSTSYATGLTYAGGSANGPQNGPQPFPIDPPFSVSMWARPIGTADGCLWWFGRDPGPGPMYGHYFWYQTIGDRISASTATNSAWRDAYCRNGSFPKKTWTHVTGVWHSDSDRRIYINGIFQTQNTQNSTPGLSGGSIIILGATNRSGSIGDRFNGNIFDLRMYSRALSSPEVMAIYNPLTRFDLFKSQRYSRPFPGVSIQSFTGTFSGSFGAATGSLSGTFNTNHTGTFTESFSAPTGSFTSTFYTSHTGTFTEDLGAVTGSFAGTFYTSHTGTFSEDFGAVTGSISAVYSQDRIGTLSGSLGAVVGSLSGNFTTLHTGSFDENFGALTGSLTGTFFTTHTGEFTESLGPVTGSFSGAVANNIGTFSETLGGMTGTISGTFYTSHTGTFSETFGPVTGSIVSTFTPAPVTGSFTEIFGAMTGSLSGTFSTEIIYDPGTPPMDVFWVGSFW